MKATTASNCSVPPAYTSASSTAAAKFEVVDDPEPNKEGTAVGFGGQPGEKETGQFLFGGEAQISGIAIDNSGDVKDPSNGDGIHKVAEIEAVLASEAFPTNNPLPPHHHHHHWWSAH